MRKRHEKPWVPTVGHRMKTAWLPRDIRLGWRPKDQRGSLLLGWDFSSTTYQLWQVVTTGPDGESEFVGFISSQPPR